MKRKALHIVSFIGIVILAYFLSEKFFFRWDLTSEKRYSLSDNTKHLLKNLNEEMNVTIYLDGDLNSGFLRLRKATKELLDEFDAYSSKKIQYEFVNPSAGATKEERQKKYEELEKKGMRGIVVYDGNKEGESRQKIVYPWAEITYNNKTKTVNLLKNIPNNSGEENLNISIESLEYEITDVLRIITSTHTPKVAFLEGHNEYPEPLVYDFTQTLSHYYQVDRGTLSGNTNELNDYEAVIIAAPINKFSEKDKFILDQYIMQGGRILWLLDGTRISLDSLSTASQTIGIENDLNLTDQLFKYGFRINADLVQDVQCSMIPVNVSREGDNPKYELMSWYYSPLLLTIPTHPISKNIAPVKSEFVSSINFVNNDNEKIRKTPLLITSTGTHIQNIPSIVSMDVINIERNGYYFNTQNAIVAAILEGVFPSVFTNRMIPTGITTTSPIITESKPTKMIVIADGDVIRNDIQGTGANANILPLGYDRYINQKFGNSEFLLNAVNYLTDDDGWLNLRSREIQLRLLNKPAIIGQRRFWQVTNLLLPLIIILLYGGVFYFIRKKKYTTNISVNKQHESIAND
ncbi:MAG: gliding motility-associated ABC transporter substrate-binding protein GldG [Paludibacteraceae bacterium]|nr:gliding motility-associated ABC transporter substrate-binding protein GldG [Paludibacteraceae bacterium]MEE3484251.1 gliding motility-associated ABC transporter substrate-binding protein GldG [Bacteroidales bacterium]